MNESEVKLLEEESEIAWKNGDIEKTYEINKKLSNEFPQSYMFKVRCMNNLLQLKRFDEAKDIYLKCLSDMKDRGCGWKLFDSQEKNEYLLPMRLKESFFRSCLTNGYYEELKGEALEIIDFYCKARI